jgi:pimeloyl-ACP methyl ester carboxylesterase
VGSIVMSKPFINEVVWLDPFDHVLTLDARAIIFHGTDDSRAPFSVAKAWASRIGAQLVPFEGAEHGLCAADDEDFTDPQTLAWQGEALTRAVEWFLQS